MTTFVLIHGAFQGGWIWKPVASRLREVGHLVFAPTLDGCGERAYQLRPGITTETQAEELAKFLWSEDLRSDDPAGALEFPTLRVRGELALVGVSSAVPTALFLATGRVGKAQLGRLERRLAALRDAGLCRVVLIHHPVTQGAISKRRELRDAPALRALLARVGAELVLHGHGHRTLFASLPGPSGEIPVVGVRSASDATDRPEKRAQYHVYDIERGTEGFRITARIRGYAADGCFAALGEHVLR